MEPTFSEFSYGYAITEELATGILGTIHGHPIFPSLKQEGQIGGGYDVKFPLYGSALYLQFKRSHFMKRVYCENFYLFHNAYYRMYLMRSKYSIQHELLIHLELSGNDVFYIAPEFYTDDELTEFYTNKTVYVHSAMFSPSDVGHLPNDDSHYVAFDHDMNAYLCSKEPKRLEKMIKGQDFQKFYSTGFKNKRKPIDSAFFDKLTENTIDVIERSHIQTNFIKNIRSIRKDTDTLEDKARFAALLSRAYFDVELFIVDESS